MDKQQFCQLIAAYGAYPERWPEPMRTEGVRLAAQYPALLEEERALNALLGGYQTMPLDKSFAKEIIDAAAATAYKPRFSLRNSLPAASMMAACAVVGFWLGIANQPVDMQTSATTQMAQTDTSGDDTKTLNKIVFGATEANEVWL